MPDPPTEPHLAFTRLFVANQAAFHGFLISLVHDLHAADDLLQDLAGRLWAKFDAYDPQRPFVAWGLGFASEKHSSRSAGFSRHVFTHLRPAACSPTLPMM